MSEEVAQPSRLHNKLGRVASLGYASVGPPGPPGAQSAPRPAGSPTTFRQGHNHNSIVMTGQPVLRQPMTSAQTRVNPIYRAIPPDPPASQQYPRQFAPSHSSTRAQTVSIQQPRYPPGSFPQSAAAGSGTRTSVAVQRSLDPRFIGSGGSGAAKNSVSVNRPSPDGSSVNTVKTKTGISSLDSTSTGKEGQAGTSSRDTPGNTKSNLPQAILKALSLSSSSSVTATKPATATVTVKRAPASPATDLSSKASVVISRSSKTSADSASPRPSLTISRSVVNRPAGSNPRPAATITISRPSHTGAIPSKSRSVPITVSTSAQSEPTRSSIKLTRPGQSSVASPARVSISRPSSSASVTISRQSQSGPNPSPSRPSISVSRPSSSATVTIARQSQSVSNPSPSRLSISVSRPASSASVTISRQSQSGPNSSPSRPSISVSRPSSSATVTIARQSQSASNPSPSRPSISISRPASSSSVTIPRAFQSASVSSPERASASVSRPVPSITISRQSQSVSNPSQTRFSGTISRSAQSTSIFPLQKSSISVSRPASSNSVKTGRFFQSSSVSSPSRPAVSVIRPVPSAAISVSRPVASAAVSVSRPVSSAAVSSSPGASVFLKRPSANTQIPSSGGTILLRQRQRQAAASPAAGSQDQAVTQRRRPSFLSYRLAATRRSSSPGTNVASSIVRRPQPSLGGTGTSSLQARTPFMRYQSNRNKNALRSSTSSVRITRHGGQATRPGNPPGHGVGGGAAAGGGAGGGAAGGAESPISVEVETE